MPHKRKRLESFLGIIGNGETCALVSPSGSIQWLCAPRFDSPFIFGRLIDEESGYFDIRPAEKSVVYWQQYYRPATAALDTVCAGPNHTAILRITDWMPWGKNEIRRLLTPERGNLTAHLTINPTFNYRRATHRWTHELREISGKPYAIFTATSDIQSITLHVPADAIPLRPFELARLCHKKRLRIPVKLNEPVEVILTYGDGNPQARDPEIEGSLQQEKEFWTEWLRKCVYKGVYLDTFRRSLITLKLLTYAPTGAFLAAATTSIPQRPGTGSNWDYRLSWVRDGSFCASAFAEAGFIDEAKAFIDFLFNRMNTGPGEKPWQPLYRIDGSPDCTEEILEHLSGFHGEYPVRIGNLAYTQDQHDAEGSVLDALWDVYRVTRDKKYLEKHWAKVSAAADFTAGHWMEPDNGIWELRGVTANYTHSKVLCWTALDRAVNIAGVLGKSEEATRWRSASREVKAEIMRRGWNRKMGTFTFAYDMPLTDSSLLTIPLNGMLPPSHPSVHSMVKRIENELVYNHLAARNIFETTPFLLTTYWLARYYIAAGQKNKARHILDHTIRAMTDLELFCEQAVSPSENPGPSKRALAGGVLDLLTSYNSVESFINFTKTLQDYYANRNTGVKKNVIRPKKPSKAQLKNFKGNFPQAYSHEELIRTIIRLGI